MSRQKRNVIILAGLCVVFVLVVLNEFVLPSEGSSAQAAQDVTISTESNQPAAPSPQDDGPGLGQPIGYHPLPLNLLAKRRQEPLSPKRQIFSYYEPPPAPVVPIEPPDPPPLSVQSIEPTSVYAGTDDFSLVVYGQDFPPDAQIYVDQRPSDTEWISDSELITTLESQWFDTPGGLTVEVKASSGELYSKAVSLPVLDPPKPDYKYVGRIDNTVYFQKGETDHLTARVGQTVEDRWRVADVGGGKVVLEDVNIGIDHTIELVDPAPRPAVRLPTPQTRRINRPRPRTRTVPQRPSRQPNQP